VHFLDGGVHEPGMGCGGVALSWREKPLLVETKPSGPAVSVTVRPFIGWQLL